MADCELLAGCLFFNDKMATKPATAEMMKSSYCRGNNSACARFLVFNKLGRPMVPSDLYPDNVERAKLILSSK
jgi:hypothetical protein